MAQSQMRKFKRIHDGLQNPMPSSQKIAHCSMKEDWVNRTNKFGKTFASASALPR